MARRGCRHGLLAGSVARRGCRHGLLAGLGDEARRSTDLGIRRRTCTPPWLHGADAAAAKGTGGAPTWRQRRGRAGRQAAAAEWTGGAAEASVATGSGGGGDGRSSGQRRRRGRTGRRRASAERPGGAVGSGGGVDGRGGAVAAEGMADLGNLGIG